MDFHDVLSQWILKLILFDFSPDIKFGILLLATFLIIKYGKACLSKIIRYIGLKFVPNEQKYIRSFFENSKIVDIAFYLIPLCLMNYFVFVSNVWLMDISVNIPDSNELINNSLTQSVISKNEMKIVTVIGNILYLINYLFAANWLAKFLNHTVKYLYTIEKYKNKPLHSFSQIVFVSFIIVSIATIYAHYTNQSPKTLFTTLSVMSVAVFLTLKDVILGIVSTILIMANDIVRVGDWIKNEKYGADGTIIEINLITVKILNFDKTVATIPTYSLVSEGFHNQQEILNSGKRLIKQSIRIEALSVKHLTKEEVQRYKEIDVLKPYIEKREEQLDKENINPLNDKYFTNLGLFRKYVEKMIENNSMVYHNKGNGNKDENVVVRLIEGNKEGIGFEIYCFSKKTNWDEYNYLISILFEQIYASAKEFDLVINS